MDFDMLLHKLAEDQSWALLYLKDEDAYRLQVATPGDRFQDVFVNFRKDPEDAHVATMWSVISDLADFNMSDPPELLRFNWRNLYGSLAIKDDKVVLLVNQLTDDANWNEVAKAVRYLANNADSIEKSIYGDRDEN